MRRYRDTISVKKRGHDRELYILTPFLAHRLCSRRLSELRSDDFAAYRDERLREVLPATVKRQTAVLRHLFEIARDEWGLPIRENPVGKLKFMDADQRRERRLRPGEFERLLEAASACRNPLIEPIVRLAVETGMRRGEILAIRNEDIDTKNRCLLIRGIEKNRPPTNNSADPRSYCTFALLYDRDQTGTTISNIRHCLSVVLGKTKKTNRNRRLTFP